jgi:acetyltransferase
MTDVQAIYSNVAPDQRLSRCALDNIFAPRSVAVIGATEAAGSVGRTVMSNLLRSPFGGPVYPVNPKRRSVLGVPCCPSVAAIPERVDLAVIVTPAAAVPSVIEQCGGGKVGSAIVISAGFRETGEAGKQLEQRVLANARAANIRLVGPNCLGVMSPHFGLNATFAAGMAKPGNVAFLSQSGALCTAVLDWSLAESVGFSAFVSTGSMLDVNWGDLIEYFGEDPTTKSILIYMESIGDVRSFMSAARAVALIKPIIVIKAGRTEAASKAAASHTGAMTGSHEVLDAAFRRAGVLRVDRISDLFYMAEILSRAPRVTGKRLAIVTNAGGPGVLATDSLVSGGGELAPLSDATTAALNASLPAHWSHNNPIDVLGDAGPERYASTLETIAKDPGSDGLLVILTPQDMTDAVGTAEHLCESAKKIDKPVLASWMGGQSVVHGKEILNHAGIPTFDYPDSAALAFNYMWKYAANLKLLYETPSIGDGSEASVQRTAAGNRIIESARRDGRTLLNEVEVKELLLAYGIPVIRPRFAAQATDAVQLAQEIGYPVVLKLFSHTITHKTDVGGVKLNLAEATAVRRAFDEIRQGVIAAKGEEHFQGVTVQPMARLGDGYELILGSTTDPQFGPVLLFGSGGQLVEVFKDRALALPPLNDVLARRMIEQTRICQALKGVRGRKAVDLAELERIAVRFSQLVLDQPWIKEIEINPILASSNTLVALDARAVLHDPTTPEGQLPTSAIRPYPAQYVTNRSLSDGTPVRIRPIRPADEPLMVRFHEALSEDSVRFRYFYRMTLGQRINHERLVRVCLSDYQQQVALVADRLDEKSNSHEIIGVGRLGKLQGSNDAEFAVLVADNWQQRGLGRQLLEGLIQVARTEKVARLVAEILPDNIHMQRLCQSLGFALSPERDGVVCAEMCLDGTEQLNVDKPNVMA